MKCELGTWKPSRNFKAGARVTSAAGTSDRGTRQGRGCGGRDRGPGRMRDTGLLWIYQVVFVFLDDERVVDCDLFGHICKCPIRCLDSVSVK